MVYFSSPPKNSLSSGELWHDSAVSAARLIEKYVHQEEQSLQLSELISSGSPDYDKNGANRQFLITESASDTFAISSNRVEGSQRVGSLPSTSFLYRISENRLFLWDMLDKSGTRSCSLPTTRFEITSVGLAESRDSASRFMLVVATIFDVALFYFNPDKICEEAPPVPSGYVAPTGGVAITAISAPSSSKQIFLGAEDGSVYELVYTLEVRKSLPAFLGKWQDDRRCYLSVLSRPFTSSLPPFIRSLLSSILPSDEEVRCMQVDPCRQLLFAVQGSCGLSVYDFSDNQLVGQLSSYQISDSVRSAFRSAGRHSMALATVEVVEVVPCNPHIGGDIVCVLVTQSGARVFIKGNRSSAHASLSKTCKFCSELKFKHFAACKISSIFVSITRIPPAELFVDSASSPDGGRTVVMACHDNRGAGLAIVSPDESSVLQRQDTSGESKKYRERFDYIPISGESVVVMSTIPDTGCDKLKSIQLVDALPCVSSEVHLGGVAKSWRVIATTPDREITVSPLSVSEQLMELIKTENLYAIRDFALQWKPENLACLLMEVVDMNLVGKILFSPETASAIGLIDSPGLGASPQPSAVGVLGSVVQTQLQNLSARTRGVAILISRLVRPIWFVKAFTIDADKNFVTIKPGLSSAVRQYMQTLLKPLTGVISSFRHQLIAGASGEEAKTIEGFLVVLNALNETMELMRLVETGQLTAGRHREEKRRADLSSAMEGVDQILVRDLVMSAGIGECWLIELLVSLDSQIDMAMVRKHCPLLFPGQSSK